MSQHNQSPTMEHDNTTLHALRYLKGTVTHSLLFNNNSSLDLKAFCESNWAICPIT